MQRTSTPPCAACGAHTLLRKKDLYPITLAAALLDSTLRHLKARTVADLSQREEQTAPWSQLSVLNDVMPIVCRDIGQCQQQHPCHISRSKSAIYAQTLHLVSPTFLGNFSSCECVLNR